MNLTIYLNGLVENYKLNLRRLARQNLSLSTVNKLQLELHNLHHWNMLTKLLNEYYALSEEKKKLQNQPIDQRTVKFRKDLGEVNAKIDDITSQFSGCLTAMLNDFAIPFTASEQHFYFWSSDSGENKAYIEADKQGSINYVAKASIPLFELLLGPATYDQDTQEIKFEEKAGSAKFLLRDILYPDAVSPPTHVPDLQRILWASLSQIFAQKAVEAVEKATTKPPVLHVYLPCQLNRDSNFWQCELPIIQSARAKKEFEVKYYKYDETQKSWIATSLEDYKVVRMRPMSLATGHPVADADQHDGKLDVTVKTDHAGKSYLVRAHAVSMPTLHRVADKWKVFAKDKERSRELSVLLNSICTLGKDHRVKNDYQVHSLKRHQDHELTKLICDKMDEAGRECVERMMAYQTKRHHIKEQLGLLKLTRSTDMDMQRNKMSVSAQLKLLQAYKRHFQYEEIIDIYKSTQNKHLRNLPQAKAFYVWACNRASDDLKNECVWGDTDAISEKIKKIMHLLDMAYGICQDRLKTHANDKLFLFEQARNLEIRSQLKGILLDKYHKNPELEAYYQRIVPIKALSSVKDVFETYSTALLKHNVSAAGSKYMEYYANLTESETPSSKELLPQEINGGCNVRLLQSDDDMLLPERLAFQRVAERTYNVILIDGLDECNVPAILRSAFIAAYNMGDEMKLKRVMDRMTRVEMRDNELSYFQQLKVCKFIGTKMVSVHIGDLPEYHTIAVAQTTLAKTKEADANSHDPYVTLMHRSYDYRQSLADNAEGQKRGGNMQYGGSLPQQVISKNDIHIFSKFVSEKTIGELIPSKETIELVMRQAENGVNPVLYDFLNKMLSKYYQGEALPQQKLEQITDVNEVLTIMTDLVALNYKLMSNAADLNIVPYRDLDFAMKALCAVLGDETAARKATYDSGTSLSIMYAMQVGDCRHHAETTQLLFDIWKRKRLESLLDQPEDFKVLEATQLRTIDTKLDDSVAQLGNFDYAHTFNVLCTPEPNAKKNKFVIYDAFILEQDPAAFEFEVVKDQIEFSAKNIYRRNTRFQFAPYTGDKGKRAEDVYGLSLQGFNGVSKESVTACIFDEDRKKQTCEQVNVIVKNEKIKTFKTASIEALWEMLVEKGIPFIFDNYVAIPPADLDAVSAHLSVKFPKFHQAPKDKVDCFIQVLYKYQPALYASLLKPAVAPAPQPVSASLLLKIMAHPVTKVAAVILILAGIAGLVFGGLGLGGIALGLTILLSSVVTGCGGGSAVLGGGLLTASFFASDRMNKMQPAVLPAPAI